MCWKIFLVLVLIPPQMIFGQVELFITSQTYPETLTDEDSVLIIYEYSWPGTPCFHDSTNISVSQNKTLLINTYYSIGDWAAPCPGKDTANLGLLSGGNYTVILILNNLFEGYSDSDTLTFYVDGEVSTSHNLKVEEYNIYPNPSDGKLFIDGVSQDLNINIVNSLGENMFSLEVSKNHCIDVSSLNAGVYFIQILDSKKKLLWVEKLAIKQD